MIKMIKLTVVYNASGEVKKYTGYYDVTEVMSLDAEGMQRGGNTRVGLKHGGIIEVMETIDEIMYIMGVSVDEVGAIE